MKRSKVFLINALILAGTSVLIQALDVWFKVYISNLAGAQVMGMYQLILSVYGFALTLATSGINLAATRIIAEEIGRESGKLKAALKRCIGYALFFGCFACLLLFCVADFAATHWLQNGQTALPLKLLSFTLPVISTSSVFYGYFNACRRVIKSASSQLLEQILRTVFAVALLVRLRPNSIFLACVCITVSAVLGEILSFLYSLVLFKLDVRKLQEKTTSPAGITKRMLHIALPMAFSAYVRSGLLSIEHLLIPISLRRYGSSYGQALSVYGIIHGVVLPVLLFPSAIIGAFSGLLIPELSENMANKGAMQEKNTKHSITEVRTNYIIRRVYQITLTFAIGVCCTFVFFSEEIARITSNASPDVAFYIRLLALMVPIMYLDSVTDSFLKALNEQVSSMRYNIIDSALCVLLVITLLPMWGIKGYICVLYISEILNTFLSVMRLWRVAAFRIDWKRWVIKPTACALAAMMIARLLPAENKLMAILLLVAYAVLYIGLLVLTKTVSKADVEWVRSFFKRDEKRKPTAKPSVRVHV